VKLSLPLPPSANHYRVPNGHGGMRLTAEARAYKKAVMLSTLAVRNQCITEGPVSVRIGVYRRNKRGDADNFCKMALDVLQGVAYRNDAQIQALHVVLLDHDPGHPRLEVEVEPYTLTPLPRRSPTPPQPNGAIPHQRKPVMTPARYGPTEE
jgi:crossover junction endodeoxyribonuclease RusA